MNESHHDLPHILVVEDEQVLRHVRRSILEEKGCRVDTAGSAEDGSKQLVGAVKRGDREAQQASVGLILEKPCPIGELLATVGALVDASASRSGQADKKISVP